MRLRGLFVLLPAVAACASAAPTAVSGGALGHFCATNADCANGLTCVDVSAHFVAQTATCFGATAAGPQLLCTVACALPADCSPYAAGGVCQRFGCEKNDFCLGAPSGKAATAGDASP